MLIKYRYQYNPADPYLRSDEYRSPATGDMYGVVFALQRSNWDDGAMYCYDISMERIRRYLNGEKIIDEFLPPIRLSDVDIVHDAYSDAWRVHVFRHNPEKLCYDEVESYSPGCVEVTSFPEFSQHGFWWRANDLNLEEADFAILQRYVEEYGAFYVRYIQQTGLVE